ncbi:MAG: hypothetical protein DDT30_01553 [Dehalococcoidia bacterium]|nr:hypothetical protein [Bacillota bacterium]
MDGGEVILGAWHQRAVPQRVKGRPGPGTIAIGEVPDQRAGAAFGDGALQPVEVDWPGEPAGGGCPHSEAGLTAPGAQRDAGPDLSSLPIGETCTAPPALVREALPLI